MAADGATPELAIEIWWAHNEPPVVASPNGPMIIGKTGPAVLFLHGGGFRGGGLGSRPALFAALADRGYNVYDAEYSLSPPPRWDQAPGDALCALAYVQGMQFQLGGDPKRVVVIGESAGGNLALMAAYAAARNRIPSSCGAPQYGPSGVIAISPAVDLAGIWQDSSPSTGGHVPFPQTYISGTPREVLSSTLAPPPRRTARSLVAPT